ncbi:unnamed protein product [Calypogeia fissa]
MASSSPRSSESVCFWNFGRKKKSSVDSTLPRDDEPSQSPDGDPVEHSLPKGFDDAGWLSSVYFAWVGPLLKKAQERPLEMQDIPRLPETDDANSNFFLFEESWKKQKDLTPSGELPSLSRALWRCYKKPFMAAMVISLLWVSVFFLGPVILFLLINYLNSGPRNLIYGLALVTILLVAKCSQPLTKFSANFWCQKLGCRMWAAVGSAVYRKTLVLSNKVRQERSVGEITNIMSNDLYQFLTLIWNIQQGLVLPIQLGIATVLLYQVVGLSMLAGLLSLIAVLSGNVLLASLMRRYKGGLLKAKDERMRVTVECFGNMKMVKL